MLPLLCFHYLHISVVSYSDFLIVSSRLSYVATMSIYALPGPLYKLVSSGISNLKSGSEEPSKEKLSSFGDAQGSSSVSCSSRRRPLHRNESGGSASSDGNSVSSSSGDNSTSNANRNGNGVVIAVKEAKIDPERLIRSLASKPDSKKAAAKSAAPPTGGGESSDDQVATDTSTNATSAQGSSPKSNSSSRRLRRSQKADLKKKDDSLSREYDPHEEAIKIEISVSFNGRDYTATRTLPRILQFRYDLIEEFRARRKFRERRKKKAADIPKMTPTHAHVSDDEDEEDSLDSDDVIPEIPRLADESSAHAGGSSHVLGGGFSMLNALLRPYGPALERWLRNVIDIVPHDSQCLTQFLWEPISGHAISRKFERRTSSMSTLGAIQETDDLEQYDSDTDEYLINH